MGNFWDDVRKDATGMRTKEIIDLAIWRGTISDEEIAAITETDIDYVIAKRQAIEAEKKEAAEREAEEQRIKDELKKEGADAKTVAFVDGLLRNGKLSDQEIAEIADVDFDYVLLRKEAFH